MARVQGKKGDRVHSKFSSSENQQLKVRFLGTLSFVETGKESQFEVPLTVCLCLLGQLGFPRSRAVELTGRSFWFVTPGNPERENNT